MYPALAGVVIPDDDDLAVMFSPMQYRQYGEDEPFIQVIRAQQYGDDGLTDGAEGLGVVQAQRLKRKLGAQGRRLRVGPSPYAVEGGSEYSFGFGVAPLVAVGAAKAGAGVFRRIGKKPAHKVAAQQGPVLMRAAIAGDAGALAELLRLAQGSATSRSKAIYRRFYDQAIAGGAGRVAVATPTPTRLPAGPGTAPAPVPGPVTDATGRPAPYLPEVPSPIPPAAGGPPTASEDVARAAEAGGEEPPLRAGIGLDLKNPLVLAGLAALAVFVVPAMVGGGSRRRNRR